MLNKLTGLEGPWDLLEAIDCSCVI